MSNTLSELLDTPLDMLTYVVVDIEATGNRPDLGDKMVEIAAFRVEPGFRLNKKNYFHSLINPDMEIPKHAVDIHGLGEQQLRSAPDSCSVLYDFFEYAANAVPVAHRASKDMSYIKNEMLDYGVQMDFELYIDTLKLSRRLYPRQKNNLDAITDRFNIKTSCGHRRHRAAYDAESTAVAFCIMMRRVFQESCYTLSELVEYLRR
jgi:DNA polymerase III epsilon subunit family exonuclease